MENGIQQKMCKPSRSGGDRRPCSGWQTGWADTRFRMLVGKGITKLIY